MTNFSVPRPSASIYVGSLSPEVTEAALFEIFNMVGPVASIRVCRDNITRRSLGYAYVNFHNVVDAERALDTLNYSQIKGRSCRLMWSQRDPSLRKSGLGNIFIKNLDTSIDHKSLHDTFSVFGNILSCRVQTDVNGNSRGFGFVHFETTESAEAAIAKLNGMLVNDKPAYVGHYIPRKSRPSKAEEMKNNFTNIFVKNVPETMLEEEFKTLFDPFGAITSARLMKEDGKSKGFGFVNFETHEQAENACNEMNEKEVQSKVLYVGRAQKKTERKEELLKKYEALRNERLNKYRGVNLYIKNLDDEINDDKLREEFAPYGTITSAKVQSDDKGNSRGFGFVCFSTPEEASKAISETNGKMFGSKPIYVALAQRKEDRRQQLAAQHAQRASMRMAQQNGVMGGGMYPQAIFFQGRQQHNYYQPMMPRNRWQGSQQGQAQGQGQQQSAQGTLNQNQQNAQGENFQMRAGQRPRGPREQKGQSGQTHQSRHYSNNMVNGASQNSKPKGNYKYTSNARNKPEQNGYAQQVPVQQQQQHHHHQEQQIVGEPLTASVLANMSPEDQKNMLGEKLYPLIEPKAAAHSGKVTGMLLEMDNSELLHLLESPDSLNEKINEALRVLEVHTAEE